MLEADVFRYELAKDQREHGDARHDDAERDPIGIVDELGNPAKVLGQRCRKTRAAIRTREDADQRDAELHRGKKLCGRIRKRERGLGAVVTFFRTLLEANLACGDDGDLRHGEDAVSDDQQENDDDLEADARHGS
jgi:hypothetical protein